MNTSFTTPDFSEAAEQLNKSTDAIFADMMTNLNKTLVESAQRAKAAKRAEQKKSLIKAAVIGLVIGGAYRYYRHTQQKAAAQASAADVAVAGYTTL